MTLLQVAVIGTGSIAQSRHLPNIKRSDKAVLRGIYNRTLRHSQETVKNYGGKIYQSLDELWNDDQVQAVIIATPVSSHAALVIEALKAGKYVLVEKPVTQTVAEITEIQRIERASSSWVMVSHNQRYYPPHQKLKELLNQHVIGDIISFRTFLGPPLENAANMDQVSAVADIGSHRLDLIHWLFNSDVSGVFARFYKYTPIQKRNDYVTDHEDLAHVILELKNGVIGTLVCSQKSVNHNDRTTLVMGTEGSITVYGQSAAVRVEKSNGEIQNFAIGVLPQTEVERTIIDEVFFDTVLNKTKPPITSEDGKKTIEVLEAIQTSNRLSKWINLNR